LVALVNDLCLYYVAFLDRGVYTPETDYVDL
jgi:hypothetical protein